MKQRQPHSDTQSQWTLQPDVFSTVFPRPCTCLNGNCTYICIISFKHVMTHIKFRSVTMIFVEYFYHLTLTCYLKEKKKRRRFRRRKGCRETILESLWKIHISPTLISPTSISPSPISPTPVSATLKFLFWFFILNILPNDLIKNRRWCSGPTDNVSLASSRFG